VLGVPVAVLGGAAVEGLALLVPVALMPFGATLRLEAGCLTEDADLLIGAALRGRIDALLAAGDGATGTRLDFDAGALCVRRRRAFQDSGVAARVELIAGPTCRNALLLAVAGIGARTVNQAAAAAEVRMVRVPCVPIGDAANAGVLRAGARGVRLRALGAFTALMTGVACLSRLDALLLAVTGVRALAPNHAPGRAHALGALLHEACCGVALTSRVGVLRKTALIRAAPEHGVVRADVALAASVGVRASLDTKRADKIAHR